MTVYALQARLALSERFAFIATKDGYSEVQLDALGIDETGWNDIAFGFKYVAVADRALGPVVVPREGRPPVAGALTVEVRGRRTPRR